MKKLRTTSLIRPVSFVLDLILSALLWLFDIFLLKFLVSFTCNKASVINKVSKGF